jgi:hypothetical protein
MAIASPIHNVLEGEFSPLAEGRTDIDRYARGMRYMSNMVPCVTGPGIGRSGTYFERRCFDPAYPSKLLPFEFNENETITLEFAHHNLRFHYDYTDIAANRENKVVSVTSISPFKFVATAGHSFTPNLHLVFYGFDGRYNVNAIIMKVVTVTGNTITMDLSASPSGAGVALTGSEVAVVVYEINTPYSRDDVQNLRIVQELNTCYLFCTKTDGSGDYRTYVLKRQNTFNWNLVPLPFQDGPYLDINTTTTYLIPTGKGTWAADMTSNTTPAPYVCAASSEVVGHEAWRAFDNDIDSYWEGNSSQAGWLSYQFENGFVDVIPQLAGYTGGGMTVSADSEAVGHLAWQACDHDPSTTWQSVGNVPQSWYIDVGVAKTIVEYAIRSTKLNPEYAPANFTLRGSNTGTGGPWTTVDTRTGIQWLSGQRQQFTVQTPGSYRFYSISVTAVNQQYVTTITPAVGVKGTVGYIPRKTVTTLTPTIVAFASIHMSAGGGTLRCVDGYTIYLGRYAKGKELKAHAPRTWYFEGYDGTNWNLLDSQQDYTNWINWRSQYFAIQNSEAFKAYRIRIQTVYQEGDVNPRIGRLVFSSPDSPAIALVATSTTGINQNSTGFQSGDVGRSIRLRDADNFWRWCTITAVNDPASISVQIVTSDPLVLDGQVKFWRLGIFSDNTGWPVCGVLHEDRLWVAGAMGYPDFVIASNIGNHLAFQQADSIDTVFDTSAIVARCGNKLLSRIVWMKSCIEAIRIGTGKDEFVITTSADGAITPRNLKARVTTHRGSSKHEAIFIDNEIVFLQQGQRALYSLSFALTATGVQIYKSTLMSKLGAHLLQPPVVQIVYQQEPHSIIWGRRSDGSVVAMTYSTDEDIFGGHRHDFSANIKDICTVYSPTDKQHSLWMVAMRHINGQDVHYIERLSKFWDYGNVLENDAIFVDSALRYYGTTPTDKVYGLTHLEGQYLNVLADNIVYKGLGPVTNGMLPLVRMATTIVLGEPMVMQGEIIAPEAGAQDGTAQGKSKRPHSVVLRLWESAKGEVGRWDEDHGELMWTPCEYNFPQDASIPDVTLRTCLTNTVVLPGGYGTLGTVAFRQTDPLPFNVAGVYPQTYVEDER